VKTRLGFILMGVLLLVAGTFRMAPGLRALPNSCLMNPPPNCEFDPVCTADCDVQFPKDPEASCECKLGCCRPID